MAAGRSPFVDREQAKRHRALMFLHGHIPSTTPRTSIFGQQAAC